jgi:hypothetical protein
MILPDLNVLLEYKNPAVLKLYKQNHPNNRWTEEEAFEQMLKYLWLSAKHVLEAKEKAGTENFPNQVFITKSMRELDHMWHEFILFTEDYTNFCNKYFGQYMHHLPSVFDDVPVPREIMEHEIEMFLPFIYGNLGEETLRFWFASYLNGESLELWTDFTCVVENTSANLVLA